MFVAARLTFIHEREITRCDLMLTLNLISDHFVTCHLRFYVNGPTLIKFPSFQIKRVPLSECYTRFFSAQPWCYLTFLWIELEMLLRCCLIHKSIIITETHFIFTIFVSISRPKSIYVLSIWSNFHFHLHFHYD